MQNIEHQDYIITYMVHSPYSHWICYKLILLKHIKVLAKDIKFTVYTCMALESLMDIASC